MPRGIPNRPKEGKKGKPTWAPARMLDVQNKDPNYRYRWVDKSDPANVVKKEAEGWLPASSIHGAQAKHDHPEGVEDGKPLTGLTDYRELQLWTLSNEQAEAREEYFQGLADQQERGIKDSLKRDLRNPGGSEAAVYGKVVIE